MRKIFDILGHPFKYINSLFLKLFIMSILFAFSTADLIENESVIEREVPTMINFILFIASILVIACSPYKEKIKTGVDRISYILLKTSCFLYAIFYLKTAVVDDLFPYLKTFN